MKVSKEEILHIARLADLKLNEKEIPDYIKNLQDILNFANIIDKINIENLDISTGVINNCNVFRKDEIKEFEDNQAILNIAPETEDRMIKIPKII